MHDRRGQHSGQGGQGPPEETRNGLDSRPVVVVVVVVVLRRNSTLHTSSNLQNYNLHLNYEQTGD